MTKTGRFLRRLVDISKALKPEMESGRAFHTTFIIKKSRIVSIGHNKYNKTHPKTLTLNYKGEGDESYCPNVHSELAAWLKLGEEDCSNYSFVNVRIDRNNVVGMSKPCGGCRQLLNQTGFKKFYYTNAAGTFEELNEPN